MLAGALIGGWCAMVGSSFTGILLIGFIGTRGREAGGDLVKMAGLTAVAVGLGWAIYRLGRLEKGDAKAGALRRPPAPSLPER